MGGWLPDEVYAMTLIWLWLALGVAWLLNLLLLGWLVRLRMEVWANRRVIAALEAAAQKSGTRERANGQHTVAWLLLFVSIVQFFLLVRALWS